VPTQQGTPRFSLATDRGRYEIWVPAKGLVLQRVGGHGNADLVRAMIVQLDQAMSEGSPLSVFGDFEELEGYDADARSLLTKWTKDNFANLRVMHILVKSRAVATGVSVANVALRGAMRSHTERARFEAAFALELAQVTATSPRKG